MGRRGMTDADDYLAGLLHSIAGDNIGPAGNHDCRRAQNDPLGADSAAFRG